MENQMQDHSHQENAVIEPKNHQGIFKIVCEFQLY